MQDAHSISVDPLFVNVAGSDFHEQSLTGSFHGGSIAPALGGNNLPAVNPGILTADAGESPVIDRGDAAFAFSTEPAPNGGYINIGAFGNTAQASESPTSYVLLLSPPSGGSIVEGQAFTITWRSQDSAGTVNIDLLQQGSGTPVLAIAAGAPNNGGFSWTVPNSLTPATNYIIRVTRNTTAATGSTGLFTISGQTHIYYVNDGSFQAGDLTTAPGNDANTGLTPGDPMASIQGVLAKYTLGAGDTVEVDRGIYNQTTNIVIGAADAGVTIQGFGTSTQGSQWPSNVATSAPAQYYRLNDASGTVATDTSGNNVNGAYVGGVLLGQSGAFGIGDTSVGFNGSQYVQLPSGQTSFANGFSFEVWAYSTANAFYAPFFDMSSGAGTANEVVFRRSSTGNDLTLDGSYGVVTASNALQLNTWQYLAVTITNTGAVSIYCNGIAVGSGNITLPTNIARQNAFLGRAISTNLSNYIGKMQEAAFYSRALSAPEIASRYQLAATLPVFSRGNRGGGSDVIDIQANNVTIDHLSINNADIGINVAANITGVTISNNDISEMQDDGIVLASGDNGALVNHNTIHGIAGFFGGAVNVTSALVTISNNTIFSAVNAAINGNTGKNSLITGNSIFGNAIGINLDTATITQNQIFGNSNYGINANSGVVATGNSVFSNGGGGNLNAGIVLQQGLVTGNAVYNNAWGIFGINQGGTANNNLVYGNINGGIQADNVTFFNGNVVYSNGGYGVFLNPSPFGGGGGSLTNNVIYGNTSGGISAQNIVGFLVQNNTVYQTTGDAVNVISANSGLVFRDNILWATNGADLRISPSAQAAVASDYNDLYMTGTGIAGVSNSVNYATLAAWADATGLDPNSISTDPLFVNLAGSDFHEQSQFGSFHGGSLAVVLNNTTGLPTSASATLATDANQSPAIDAGNPTDAFSLEPTPNGGFDNLGAYGNTAQASLSPAQYLTVQLPHTGQTLATGQTVPIIWRSQNHNGTVEIDLFDTQNSLIQTIATAAPNSGSFSWSIPTALTGGNYTIRIIRGDGAGIGSSSSFALAGTTGTYYVNDGTVQAGDWTTAPGSNSNTGLDPAHPKASIAAILAAYQLSPGNIIMVDNGTYNLTANVTLPAADSGITIEGFTGTLPILNRNNTNPGAYAFGITGATNLTIQNFEIINSYAAVVSGDNTGSTGLTVHGLNVHLFYQEGIYIGPGNNGTAIDGNMIHDGVSAGVGYYGIYSTNSQLTITNNTIFNYAFTGIYLPSSNHSTISGNTIHNGDQGIVSDTVTITGNTIYSNATTGINTYNSTITGNTISAIGGGGIYQAGIVMQLATASNNTIFSCVVGINAGSSAIVLNNRVYSNSLYGIFAQYGSTTIGNIVYSNAGGIFTQGATTITNNLIYANTSYGINLTGGNVNSITQNTIYQATGDGIEVLNQVFVSPVSIVVNSNIIWTQSGRDLVVADSQVFAFSSNYNDLYVTGTGIVGNLGGQDFASLAAWNAEFALDANSISADPLFVNPAGADGVLGFSGGVDHGADDNFAVMGASPTIDAADPSISYSSEPIPNGARANQGYTGATALATLSPAQTIQVISPGTNARLQAGQTVPITWNSDGQTLSNAAGSYASTVLSQNPLLYLKFDETTGTTAVDSSGNGLNGVYANSPAIGQTGAFGTGNGHAVAFDGGTDAVTVSSTSLDLKRTVTMSAWIKPSTLAPTWQPIFYKGAGDYPHRTYSVFLNTAGFILLSSWDAGNERAIITPSGMVGANVWTHIAVVMDRISGTAAIYINGKLAASAAPNAFPTIDAADSAAQPLYIGYSPEDPSFRYTGEIDEAAVFSTALSAAAISAQYLSTKGTTHIDLINSTNAVVQSIATGVHGSSFANWTIPTPLPQGLYRIRVTSDLAGAVAGFSQPILIVPAGHDYYVNDGSLIGDTTDTAVGNNANDGKTPNTPMASIEAVINTYRPGSGDTIHVENGTYTLSHDIYIYAADSGLTIAGPTSGTATLNRGNTGDRVFSFVEDGTHNVTIDHLGLTGAGIGVFAPDTSVGIKNITISNDTIFGNSDAGISAGANDSGWLVTGNTIHDNSITGIGGRQDGVYFNNTSAAITNNTVFNQIGTGIIVTGSVSGSVISGNTVFANTWGINATNATVTGNLAHDNTNVGIWINNGAIAIGNTVWRQTAANAAGFELSGGEIRGNAIYGNFNGIWIRNSSNGVTDDNRIYSNTNVGILIDSAGGERIVNNLVYNNSNGGIHDISTFAGVSILNNTVYQPVNDAITISGSTGDLVANNILWVEAGYDIDIAANSQSGFASNYNDLHTGIGANANVAFWNGVALHTLTDWRNAAGGGDAQGIAGDPSFVNPFGADGVQGYNASANNGNGYDGGADDNFLLLAASPAIGAAYAPVAPATDLLGQTRTAPIDMGAYAFTGSKTDTTPPAITGTTPAGVNSSGQLSTLSNITVTFSEPVNPVDASAVAEYDLRSSGVDGIFNTSDDVLYPISPVYAPGSTSVTLNFNGAPLPNGTYRLQIFSGGNATIHDLAGLALDGDSNGSAGGAYVRTFTISSAGPVTLTTPVQYIKLDADGLHIDVYTTPDGTGAPSQKLLKSNVSSLTVTQTGAATTPFVVDFSTGNPLPATGMSFTGNGTNGLRVIGSATANDMVVFGFSQLTFDGAVISLTTPGRVSLQPGTGSDAISVNSGTFTVSASASATSPTVLAVSSLNIAGGASLDLTNNELLVSGSSISAINTLAQTGRIMTSTVGLVIGDINVGGGVVEVRATILGDSNLDGSVNVADLGNLATNFGLTSGAAWIQGDFDYNGTVNVADLGDLATNFGQSLASRGLATGATFSTISAAVPAAPAVADTSVQGNTQLSAGSADDDPFERKKPRAGARRNADRSGGDIVLK